MTSEIRAEIYHHNMLSLQQSSNNNNTTNNKTTGTSVISLSNIHTYGLRADAMVNFLCFCVLLLWSGHTILLRYRFYSAIQCHCEVYTTRSISHNASNLVGCKLSNNIVQQYGVRLGRLLCDAYVFGKNPLKKRVQKNLAVNRLFSTALGFLYSRKFKINNLFLSDAKTFVLRKLWFFKFCTTCSLR